MGKWVQHVQHTYVGLFVVGSAGQPVGESGGDCECCQKFNITLAAVKVLGHLQLLVVPFVPICTVSCFMVYFSTRNSSCRWCKVRMHTDCDMPQQQLVLTMSPVWILSQYWVKVV